jgi:uncharacterized Fe-S cluster protein YjdI/CDGSH-type Zn-finger protein
MATDPTDAGAGGSAAPPPATERNEAPPGLTREYRSERISVLWFAERCIHSGECIRAQPAVFDTRRRPWIVLEEASADEVAEAVLRCPTGALHFRRHDGGPEEAAGEAIEVRTVRHGPYFLRGPATVTEESGRVIRSDTRMALCRCGESRHMPFCDNSHRAIGFRDPALRAEPPDEGAGPAGDGVATSA